MSLHPAQILIKPVVSEKSYNQITENRYTFRVHADAHKTQVRQAVEEIFGVRVEDVRTVNVRSKPKRRGMSAGRTREWKKAVVQLHPDDTIELFEGTAIE